MNKTVSLTGNKAVHRQNCWRKTVLNHVGVLFSKTVGEVSSIPWLNCLTKKCRWTVLSINCLVPFQRSVVSMVALIFAPLSLYSLWTIRSFPKISSGQYSVFQGLIQNQNSFLWLTNRHPFTSVNYLIKQEPWHMGIVRVEAALSLITPHLLIIAIYLPMGFQGNTSSIPGLWSGQNL